MKQLYQYQPEQKKVVDKFGLFCLHTLDENYTKTKQPAFEAYIFEW
jgi:hypothetical protein